MGIEISFGQPKKEPAIIDPGTDPAKYLEIRDKLCKKRKALEWNLTNRPQDKDIYEEELAFHKTSMKAFGISEIDYIAFLEREKSELH